MNGYANGNGKGVGIGSRPLKATHYSHPNRANEWEMFGTTHSARSYSNPESEYEWEVQEASHYSHSEMAGEWESEVFFRPALQGIRQVARATAPFAKGLAPIVAQTLLGTLSRSRMERSRGSYRPVRNVIPILLEDGEMETEYQEASFFGTRAAEARVSRLEAAHDAALTEVLAAEASHSPSESEAAAFIGAAIPIAVQSARGTRSLRAIMPALITATARLVHVLHQQGKAGQRLLRLIPTILRRTIASLRSAARSNHPITSTLARRMMAAHAARVFGNARTVRQAMIRNAILRQRTVVTTRP
jgi:hypothetical protein